MTYTIANVERLAKWFVIQPNGCWDWIGSKSLGYGTAVVNYKQTSAHRHLYQAIFGVLPKHLHLDHLCRNRACVNPKHVEPVTQRTNILRGEGFAAKNSVKTVCMNGHEYTEENTYHRLRKGVWERDCRSCRRNAVKKYLLSKKEGY